ncbi:hypothetical protein ABH924_003725 [Arthrobacter sp. GAS37]|uniref:hypothetical protein n=1 Tax=Arthrobacter sp. GAS37 TaxID=3156261 RepID=UPI0038357669
MASPRKSAVQVKARELARERAAGHLRRQETLLDLAEGFYARQAELDALGEKEAARIEAIRAETARESAGITRSMAEAVAAMVATGEPVAGVAERLGLKAKEVRSMTDAATPAKPKTEPEAADPASVPEGAEGLAGEEHGEASGSWETRNQEHSVLREPVPVG